VTVSTAAADADTEPSAWHETSGKEPTKDIETDEKSRALEPQISEPLFSQDEHSVGTTQEPLSTAEPTQTTETITEPAKDESAEQALDDALTSKKKGKKNKKKQQSMSWDVLDEPAAKESPWDDPAEPAAEEGLEH